MPTERAQVLDRMVEGLGDVRLWHLADNQAAPTNVCFRG